MINLQTEWNAEFKDFDGTLREKNHDTAVAHALVKAMDGELPTVPNAQYIRDYFLLRAAEILRDDFGIDK